MSVLAILCAIAFGILHTAQAASPEGVIAGVDDRIEEVFEAESGGRFTPASVRPSLGGGRPYFARGFSWSVVAFAGRALHLNEMLPQANEALQLNARYYLRELSGSEKKEILPQGQRENNTDSFSRIVDRDSLHWHGEIVLRLIDMYGSKGSVAAGRITPETEAKCLEPIWHYVRLCSPIKKAEFKQSKTWHLWESENHHAQHFSVAWHFAKIAKDLPAYRDQKLKDDSTLEEIYEAWNDYFIEYVRERFRKGIFVEMMSKGYNGESIRGVYNFHDFGEPGVKEHARMYLDLFWAYYAQEQFNDVCGGGKSRMAFHNIFGTGHGGPVGSLAWIYFEVGIRPRVNGPSLNALLSSYRPPAVIADIATDIEGRGTYVVRQAAQGLGTAARTGWDQSTGAPYRLRTDGGGIQRYTYCDPAFIMGTPMAEARPLNDWVAISSQGRQQGVIFSGEAKAARILPIVLPADGTYARNAFWTVQEKGSMITQMLKTGMGGKEMWVWISKEGLSAPAEEDGIIFVEAEKAYAAIRPVGTGYRIIEAAPENFRSMPANSIVQLEDKFKPVIIEVMSKKEAGRFDDFKRKVKANPPELDDGVISYQTIYGDRLTFDSNYKDKPTVNGREVEYNPEKSYDSPFLHGDYNGTTFTIEKGSRKEVYRIPLAR